MSATTSAATGRCFGIQRVCQVWERSRSALYARRARAHHRLGAGPARRGPPPRQSDAQLLAADSDRSRAVPVPRRRPSQGPRTASDPGRDPRRPHAGAARPCGRTDCSPRTAGVRAPRRPTTGGSSPKRPNVMWGTDGVRVFTLDDGWGWIFAAVEHWNAECVGWHVCKVGSRFAALDPIAQGLERLYGSLDADDARRAGASDGSR